MIHRLRFLRRPKQALLTLLALAGCTATLAGENTSPPVVWAEACKDWPSTLPIYAIKPATFDEGFTARLKRASGITEGNKIELEDEAAEPGASAYVNPITNASIALYPQSGLFVYNNPAAEGNAAMPPASVPDETKARALADELVETLGISKDQLAINPATNSPRVLYNKQTQRRANSPESEEEVYVRGIQYFQAVGGFPVIARERTRGVHIQFAAESQLLLLELNWLNAVSINNAPAITRADAEKLLISGNGKWKQPLKSKAEGYEITACHIVYHEPANYKLPLVPSLVLIAQVQGAGESLLNEFTCAALAPAKTAPAKD